MKQLLRLFLISFIFQNIIWATESAPTQEEVAILYVATFNRAPEQAGLEFWVQDSKLSLSQIAQSFFDQPETQLLYPEDTPNREFVASVYTNLFNREPDTEGWDYWENQLNKEIFSKNRFIQAVINGAQGEDATILHHKREVGLAFASMNIEDIEKAKSIMVGISSDSETVRKAIESIGATESYIPRLSTNEITLYLQVINQARAMEQNCGTQGVFSATTPLSWNDKLYEAAYAHSYDLAISDTFDHAGSGLSSDWIGTSLNKESSMRERIEYYNYNWEWIGENIAGGTYSDTPQKVVEQWLESDGHCANLMNPNFTEIGMAMVKNELSTYTHYWTQNFGKPR